MRDRFSLNGNAAVSNGVAAQHPGSHGHVVTWIQFSVYPRDHSSSERSERFVRFEPNVRSERVRYFSERETNVQALT